MFFFSKNIICNLSVSTFIAKASNFIMKFAVFCFPYLKYSIFHLASAVFILSLNVVLISLTNSSQFWVLSSSSSSLSFLCAYILATSPLRHVRIAVILLSVFITLLLLRNILIPLHQSSNFVHSPSNYSGSRTIPLDITAYMFLFASAGATEIFLSDCLYVPSEALFMIFNDSSLSNITSILFVLYELILSLCVLHHMCFVCLPVVTLPNCP